MKWGLKLQILIDTNSGCTVVQFRAKQSTGICPPIIEKKKKLDKFGWFLTLKKGFENQNFATFRVLQSIQINSDEKKISK